MMRKFFIILLGIIGSLFILLPKAYATYCLVSTEDNDPLNIAGLPWAVLGEYNSDTLEESGCSNPDGSYDRGLFFRQSIRFATEEAGWDNDVNSIVLRNTLVFDNPVVNVAVGNYPLILPPDEDYTYNYRPEYDADPTWMLSRDDYGIVTILAGRDSGNFASGELPFECAPGTSRAILRNLIINTHDIYKDDFFDIDASSDTFCLRDGGAVYVCPGLLEGALNSVPSTNHDEWLDERCDRDYDEYTVNENDCDDTDEDIHPGVTEECDGIDNDCDGRTDEGLGTSTCGVGACEVTVNNCEDGALQDCTPGDPEVEVCDGVDNDCDGSTDEDDVCVEDDVDEDGDLYCVDAGGDGVCDGLPGVLPGDCDDTEETVYPGADEVCDGMDNDCDSLIDDDDDDVIGAPTWYQDLDGDEFGNPDVSGIQCEAPWGYVSDGTDCDDDDVDVNPDADEICNGIDDNCAGGIDEGDVCVDDVDGDGDLYCVDAGGDGVCDGLPGVLPGDCDDTNPDVNPGVAEVCGDLIDNNCLGGIDEGCPGAGEIDNDRDGYCEDEDGDLACDDGSLPGDCDDGNEFIHPDADEVCDTVDNDCDDLVDDLDPGRVGGSVWYEDFDGDTFGNHDANVTRCNRPIGFVSDDTDCVDTNPAINPAAIEVCGDGVDNDCDGVSDEVPTWYEDADGDTYGNPTSTVEECEAPEGYVADNTDCDDENEDMNPGEVEVCGDGIDNDCDGVLDEGATWYIDADSDGFGNPTVSVDACGRPESYVDDNTDCNDEVTTINPAATEVCADNIDNDCDEFVDEGCIENPVIDDDNDGFCEDLVSCDDGSLPGDCDDSDPSIHPGAAPNCNNSGIDADCDGTPDIDQPICQEVPPEPEFRANLEGGASGWDCSLTTSAVPVFSQIHLFLLFLISIGILGVMRLRKK